MSEAGTISRGKKSPTNRIRQEERVVIIRNEMAGDDIKEESHPRSSSNTARTPERESGAKKLCLWNTDAAKRECHRTEAGAP